MIILVHSVHLMSSIFWVEHVSDGWHVRGSAHVFVSVRVYI